MSDMKICKNCGGDNPPDATVCGYCGSGLTRTVTAQPVKTREDPADQEDPADIEEAPAFAPEPVYATGEPAASPAERISDFGDQIQDAIEPLARPARRVGGIGGCLIGALLALGVSALCVLPATLALGAAAAGDVGAYLWGGAVVMALLVAAAGGLGILMGRGVFARLLEYIENIFSGGSR